MKILVTGALGQVGKILVKKLIEKKMNVIGLDKRDGIIKNIEIIHIEITSKDEIKKFETELKDVDILVHLASLITNDKDVIKSGPDSIDLNIKGTINLLEFLPNLKSIIFSSTYMVYGTPVTNLIKENHPTDPNVVYGASKLATEKFLQIFSKESNITLSILRIMGIYNVEKPHGQAIPSFVKMIANNESPIIFGTGEIKRNHLYIDDAINAIMTTIKNPKEGIFNIGGTDSPSNLELIEIINEKMGKKIKPIFKKSDSTPYDFITDITKAEKELGFIPKTGIKEGIKKTIMDFKKNSW
jgi:UDP-glucose 4-epimerase